MPHSTAFLAQTGSRMAPDTLNVIIAPSPCAAKRVVDEVLGDLSAHTHLDPNNSNTSFWVGQGRIGACHIRQPDGSVESINDLPACPEKIQHVQQLLASLAKH